MLNNAEIAMIVLMVVAITVVYFGVYKDAEKTEDTKKLDSTCIAKAALQVFFSICDKWGLTDEQEIILLGSPTENEFRVWKENRTKIVLNKVTLERISHLMIIYHCLRTLLPSENAANTWVKRENSAQLFSGDTALNYMLNGSVEELEHVHFYLERELI